MMNENHYVLIMAGGVGSRFWPISRTSMPKQFLDILGRGKTLIQETYERFLSIIPEENIYILTNQRYKDLVKVQLNITDESRVIGEPAMRNTAPCIAYACHKIRALNPNAIMVVAPSDHLISYPQNFTRDVLLALDKATNQSILVTLGIQPSRPDTGYGYINMSNDSLGGGFQKVAAFIEKPDLSTAKQFLEVGTYFWNAGIFVWNVETILSALQIYEPVLNNLFEEGRGLYNTQFEENFLQQKYPQAKNISIDYAVMERANNVYVLPVDFGWSDLGTWTSVHQQAEKDELNNVLIAHPEQIVLYDTKDCVINVSEKKKVVIRGLQNYIIAEANDTLLIYPKEEEQEVKKVVVDAGKIFGKAFI